ncbi:HD-GYP domain-containing protein [Bacillus salacetis]|uniref:HD-GYP domain-containing protein n=1 Tax=Bacillus salacetis TaxID=2315464 RepID=A0A3A1R6N1_9BACI|nr:HD-GYP domain-containing protein [Bacillus salacetis]RIW38878.1 HD-GYP domain-containing protein [Bacillus salacetis]
MRFLSTKTLKPGMVMATTVYNGQGKALIKSGVSVTERMIHRLIEMNIQYVYIEDGLSAGIEASDSIPVKVRQDAINKIDSTFTHLENNSVSGNLVALEQSAASFKEVIDTILKEIKGSRDLLTLLTDVFAYDSYVFHHSFNVTLYTLAIGLELGMPPKQLDLLGLGAIMHDIGKMMVPEDILMKPGKLTYEEFKEVEKHSEYGFDLLRRLHNVSLLVAHCAFQHHERLDGSGYPRGLKGDEIHPFAKIIAVADVFDALTSNRVYREAMLPHEALEILYAGSGTLFDSNVIQAFKKSVAIYPNGMVVVLSDGRRGIVERQNKNLTERPVVRIIAEGADELADPYTLDLRLSLDVTITDFDPDFESRLLGVK